MDKDNIFIIVIFISFIAALIGFIFIAVRQLLLLSANGSEIFTIILIQLGTAVCASGITALIAIISQNSENK